jgi:hypothetical protein
MMYLLKEMGLKTNDLRAAARRRWPDKPHHRKLHQATAFNDCQNRRLH